MGAREIFLHAEANSAEEGFEKLSKESEYEFGHDPYNGGTSTCYLSRVAKISDIYSKSAEKKAYKQVEKEMETISKRAVRCLDLGVMYYKLSSIQKKAIHNKEAVKPKWVQKYVVIDYYDFDEHILFSTETKKECEEYIRKYIFEYPRHTFYIAKRPVQVNKLGRDEDYMDKFEIVTRQVKSYPKRVSPGTKVEAIHKYLYYGWAAE